ncbi:hypothetical protein BLNAU_21786 [Blattamonas nauphoetae]|uniref:Uncharacterized protein n=1 Tax=Blattamonas nauphoetae TaxID=2049346 RepID=A0ABQ9WUY4_9EUKA|nr:hypothetical protein BLNAU_21786 [Blattamonas nauphoetae]
MDYDRIVQVLIVGDSDAKTCNLQYHLAHLRYFTYSLRIDPVVYTIQNDEEKVKFHLWNWNLYYRSNTIPRSSSRETSILLIAYNPMIATTFTSIEKWLDENDSRFYSVQLRMLVEHISSHDRPREVQVGAGQTMADRLGLMYGEVDSSSESYNNDLLELLVNEPMILPPLKVWSF